MKSCFIRLSDDVSFMVSATLDGRLNFFDLDGQMETRVNSGVQALHRGNLFPDTGLLARPGAGYGTKKPWRRGGLYEDRIALSDGAWA